jgi:hypothetical protein
VRGERAVARLAADRGVAASGPRLGDVAVAVDACLRAREDDGMVAVGVEGPRTIVAVDAEVVRHQPGPENEEQDEARREDGDEPQDVRVVFEPALHGGHSQRGRGVGVPHGPQRAAATRRSSVER